MTDNGRDNSNKYENGDSDIRTTKAFKRLKANMTNKTVWMYVLRYLQKHGPTYGYQIKQSLRDVYNLDLAIVTGYVILYRLEKENLVTTETTIRENDSDNQKKPQRKYYSITPKGEKVLSAAKDFILQTYEKLFDESFPGRS
ncbi:MAG: PadR family transcriptional regulator [Candidatus Hodarchaeales archaeon]